MISIFILLLSYTNRKVYKSHEFYKKMNKYINKLRNSVLALGYLALSSCIEPGTKYLSDFKVDNKDVLVVVDKKSKQTFVYIDGIVLKERTGDYNLEEVVLNLSETQKDSLNDLFRKIMSRTNLDSLRKTR